MSAAAALKVAHAAGIEVGVDGDDLVLEAYAPPPAAVLDLLSRHKAGIVALLREGEDGWSGEDWRTFFDERERGAAARGAVQAEAGARAFASCVVEWLNRHPHPSTPGRCAWCGKVESPGAVVLPFGTEPGTHTWLHAECWPSWHQGRRAEAIATLSAMGIAGPIARDP
jgi:hypothetical protein